MSPRTTLDYGLWSAGVLHAVSIMYPRTTSSAGVLRAVSLTDSRKPQGQKARKSRRFFVNFANFIINLPLLLSIYNYSAPRGNAKSSGRGACSPDRAFAFPRGGQGAQRLWTPLVPNAQHLGRGVLNYLTFSTPYPLSIQEICSDPMTSSSSFRLSLNFLSQTEHFFFTVPSV